MENILEIQEVSKHYTNKTALNKVSMQIPKGTIYGLLGPNGAGKTSLIRIINQITQADEGRVLFNGKPLSPEDIKYIGYLPEERGLYKKIKVLSQLEYFGKLRGMSAKEAFNNSIEWLKKMGLNDVRNKKIEELSKGMQQKVQFIVAVMHKPQLLILDEPFSGFDPINVELITEIILNLKQQGTSIIYSTHRMESVEKLCDNLALINNSEKILDGEVNAIKQQFSNGEFQLITAKPYTPQIEKVEILNHIINNNKNNYTIKTNCTSSTLLADVIKQTEIQHFSEITPSIHDIFIQLVSKN